MRLLFVTGSFPPMRCGVGDYTYQLAAALAGVPGNSVAVLTSVGAATGDISETLTVMPVITRWRFGEALKALRLFLHWRADVIHVQYPTQGYLSARLPAVMPLLAWLARAKVVQTWHEAYGRRLLPSLLLQLLPPADIVVVRPNYRQLLSRPLQRLLRHKDFHYIPSASVLPRAKLTPAQRSALRERYLKGQRRLIVFFGFLYRHKGVDLLFDIGDPITDHIVIAGDTDQLDFKSELQRRAASEPWVGKATLTGFLAPEAAAALLAVSDAVVLPFRLGGGEWNTSIHAAVTSGAYVITTSLSRSGYDPQLNTHFTGVDAVDQMRAALACSDRRQRTQPAAPDEWGEIAAAHMDLYRPVAV